MQKSTEELTRSSTKTLAEDTDSKISTRDISEKIMGVCRNLTRCSVIIDLLLAITMVILVAMLEFGPLPYMKMGFFCNDPKISFKFTGDTISTGMVLGITIITPLIIMWIAEWLYYRNDEYDSHVKCGNSRTKQVFTWYRHYITTYGVLGIILETMKLLIGEPRPHFLYTCKPYEAANCTDEYIEHYTCTNTAYSSWFISDASKSFPSGHACMSSYMTIFLVWYLQNRLPDRMLLVKPWLQCILYLWTLVCSMTRISDNRHHWWDVFAGIVMGIIFSLFSATVLCRHFRVNYTENVAVTRALNETVMENGQISFAEK